MTKLSRITSQQALQLAQGGFHNLAMRAKELCDILHPDNIKTYVIERNINYTNVCCCRCSFCAFSVSPGDKRGYTLTYSQIAKKIEELISIGGRQILMQGGLNPHLPFSWYEHLLSNIRQRFETVHIHAFSPTEIVYLAKQFNMTIADVLQRLRRAGLDSIPGGGSEILIDTVRQRISPAKCSADEWLEVNRQAHILGICTTATMMFGHVETLAQRVEHLDKLRQLQDESLQRREKTGLGGFFTAFTCWPFQPGNTKLARQHNQTSQQHQLHLAYAVDQLKMTALARVYLDNIDNIQASWVTQGPRIAQLSLLMGCNDIGSVMMEENVVAAAGTVYKLKLQELQSLIAQLGFQAAQRDYYYNSK